MHKSNQKFDQLTIHRRAFLKSAGGGTAALLAPGVLESSAAMEKVNVAAIYTLPVEQQWISRIHKAAVSLATRGDINYEYSENISNTDYERAMREFSEGPHNLIVGEVFGLEEASRQVARDYPAKAYLMGSSFLPEENSPRNFAVFDNYIQDASYLTGIIAGALTNSKIIGMVGGYPIPEVNRLMNAFKAGAHEMQPDIEFKVAFIGSWYDPPKAKETTLAQIDAGADVMYAERFGVSDAAQERRIPAIGNVIDTQPDYPDTVVSSALWHFGPTLTTAVKAVSAGTFKGDNYGLYSYMKHGGCSLAPLGTWEGRVPEPALELVAQRESEIRAGMFTVTIDDSNPTTR